MSRALIALVLSVSLGLAAAEAMAADLPAVLSRPATVSGQALHALMLSVAVTDKRIIAVGERGVVLLSDDGGRRWHQAKQVPVSVTLTAVRFVSASEGWAVGHLGVILHSTDAGESWTVQLDGARFAARERERAEATPDGPVKLKSIANARQLTADGPDKPFLDLLAEADGAVIAIGADGIAVRSSDHGRSWHSAIDEFPDPRGLHLYGMAQAEAALYVAGEQGLFLVVSGGVTSAVRTPYDGSFFGVVVARDGAVLVYGLRGHVLRSDDRGAHWTDVPTGLDATLNCAVVLQDGRVLLGAQSGQLIISSDDGRSFRNLRKSAAPIAALAEKDGGVIVAGPEGMARLDLQPSGNAS